MADHAWKARERQVATFFKSRGRTPLSGINSKHTSADILDEQFYVEVKLRQKHTAMTLLHEVMGEGKKWTSIPVVALCEGHKSGFGVLVHSTDLVRFAVAYLQRLGYYVEKR